MTFTEICDRVFSVFFPQRCLLCGDVTACGDFLCGKCRCVRYGRVDIEFRHGFTDAVSAMEYNGSVRKLILRMKADDNARLFRFFAGEMHEAMLEYWNGVDFDLIVPVPSTAARMKSRGFNQTELLADELGKLMKIPVCADALFREESSEAQHGLARPRRKENAERSYKVKEPAKTDGKTVLLVDDLITTGYTASACADRLLEAGACGVYVLTAARTSLRS